MESSYSAQSRSGSPSIANILTISTRCAWVTVEPWAHSPTIDQEGFASAAFHGFPDMLKPDPLSGDYGPNFFGHAWNTATYIVDHPQFGWLAFGGNIRKDHDIVRVTPQGMDHQRMCA